MSLSPLEEKILKNAQEYYTTGKQELTDEEFDALVEKLREENPNSELFKTGWGYKPTSNDKVKHCYMHIGSLKKVKYVDINVNDREFNGESKFCISPKLDGMSVVLYYDDGEMYQALTRGDGEFGVDITEKVKHLDKFNTIEFIEGFTGAVRGEIYMSPSAFKRYKVKHPDAKNHRNSTIGIVNSVDIDKDEYSYLSLGIYTVVNSSKKFRYHENNICDLNNWLEIWFAHFVVPFVYVSINFDDCYDKKYLEELRDKWSKDFNIDGLVFSLMEINQNEDKNIIYYQKAYKFQDDMALTTVTHIEWEASKHNVYVPVVCVEPVELEGSIVKRASGYNARWILEMGIHAGSKVFIQKANQIIPQIVSVLKDDE